MHIYQLSITAYLLGEIGNGATRYCCQKRIANVKAAPSLSNSSSSLLSGLVPFSGFRALALPLVWLGGIIKYKRYAYIPACISLLLPNFTGLLFEFYAAGVDKSGGYILSNCCQLFGPGSDFQKDQHTICLLLLAAGYAYETYHEGNRKNMAQDQSDNNSANVIAQVL